MSKEIKQDTPEVDDSASKMEVSSEVVTEEKTPETTVTKKEKTKSSKTNSKSMRGLVIALVSLFVILVLITATVFLKLGNQTVLARALDGVGQHKLAMASDYLGSKGLLSKQTALSTLDPSNPQDCSNIWSQVSNITVGELQKEASRDPITKESSIVEYLIAPVAKDYKDKYKFEGTYSSTIDTKSNEVSFNTTSSLVFDVDSIKKLVPLPTDSTGLYDFGLVTTSGTAKVVFKDKQLFLNLPDLRLKNKQFDEKSNLSSWYKYDVSQQDLSNLSSSTDLAKVNKAFEGFSDRKLGDMLSDDTGKAFFGYFCSGIKSYTIEAPKTMDFGTGEFARRKEVRPITLELKPDFISVYLKGLPDLIDKLNNDPKLKPFLKANYNQIKEFALASDSSSKDFPTQEEFNKQVDEMFKGFDKAAMTKEINEAITGFEDQIKITASPIKTYVDMDTLLSYGADMELIITPTTKTLSLLQSPEASNILKDGIRLKATTYDTKYGDKADTIQAPSESKDITSLPDDFSQTPLGKKIAETATKIQNQMFQASPAMDAGLMEPSFDDTTNPGGAMPLNPEMGGSLTVNPDGTYTMPDGTIFDPQAVPATPTGL